MTISEALKLLNIEDYDYRIFNSNSHGELTHLISYIKLAELFEAEDDLGWFREWFEAVIKMAEEEWSRPESVFQHIARIWNDCANTWNAEQGIVGET